jgi:phenylpyruvate tautomerase PptA (4-oxalocrotonate tautomerase family)
MRGRSEQYRQAVSDAVHLAMVETVTVPPQDRFQVITEHAPDELIYPPEYLGIRHSDSVVFIQITLNAGRTVEAKRALYARIAELLSADPGVPTQDVIISLVEVSKENWSFGNGQAQYAM